MRVVWLHPVREPVACGPGPVRIGCAADDTVTVIGTGVAPHHVTLVEDLRGLVLEVGRGCQRVYVNARAVREKALLHFGDTLTLGANKLLVVADAMPQPDTDAAATERFALRIVAGPQSGRWLAVAPELDLDANGRCVDDPHAACRLTCSDAGAVVECADSAVRINGWRCSRSSVHPGDQIVLGEQRLVVESPGTRHPPRLPPRPETAPASAAGGVPEAHSPVDAWWLIAAAAVVAALIALFLYYRW